MFDVTVISLERAVERRKIFFDSISQVEGVDVNAIYVHTAVDGDKYKSTRALCVDAADSGYALFETCLDDNSYKWLNINVAALVWSWYQVCERIIECNKPALLLYDDIVLTAPLQCYESLVTAVKLFNSQWKYVSLCGISKEYCENFGYEYGMSDAYEIAESHVFFRNEWAALADGLYTWFDTSQIISVAGAKWILSDMLPAHIVSENSWNTPEGWLLRLCESSFGSDVGGLFTVLDYLSSVPSNHSEIESYIHQVGSETKYGGLKQIHPSDYIKQLEEESGVSYYSEEWAGRA